MPYSPRLALRVGEGQSWAKCLVQEHNVAAAGSDAVGIRIADPLDHKFRMLPLAPLRLTALYNPDKKCSLSSINAVLFSMFQLCKLIRIDAE